MTVKRLLVVVLASCLPAQAAAVHCLRSAVTLHADTVRVDTLSADEPGYVLLAEQMPSFGGGYLAAFHGWVVGQVEYPDELLREGVEGMVVVSFVIDREGALGEIETLASPHDMLTDAVINAMIGSPRWEPGREGGEPVAVRQTLPVKFVLPEVPEVVEVMPNFREGGIMAFHSWVATHVVYPRGAVELGIQGQVMVSFIVEKDGSVSNVTLLRSPADILAVEALRVVRSSPKWTPGTQNGKLVRVKFVLPVNFKLPEDYVMPGTNRIQL